MNTIATTRFGEITVPEEQCITLPDGLLGFEQEHQYGLLESRPGSPFHWLQSLTNPALAFVVVNPYDFFPDYAFSISDADVERLALTSAEQTAALTLVTIASPEVTTNLLGPVIVNLATRQGRQIVLADSSYTTRHALTPRPRA